MKGWYERSVICRLSSWCAPTLGFWTLLGLGGLILAACGPLQDIEQANPNGEVSTWSVPADSTPSYDLQSAEMATLALHSSGGSLQVIEQTRPYTEDSIWNTPIGPRPIYDPHSAEMIATIGLDSQGRISSDPNQYSYPVYYADESTPLWSIPCTKYKCTIVSAEGVTRTRQLDGVPIPVGAQPSSGTDAHMIIIDTRTYTEYDLWVVERSGTGWTMKNGSVYNFLWDGMPTAYGSRGSGLPYLAGLIRPWEIDQGHIGHAIAFAYPYPAQGRCVFPASKTDGNSTLPYAIPEGARLQLDPSLNEADFEDMGLDRTGKIIARALQEYGMFLVDYSGRPKILAENLADNPYATRQWSESELNLTGSTMAAIPYTRFRVIALPAAYWNQDQGLPRPGHGTCYAYSP